MINRIRFRVVDAQPDALIVRSTIDRSFKLSSTEDTDCVIGRDDVCVLKNHGDRPATLDVSGIDGTLGRTVFRPSRQSTFTVYPGRPPVRLILGDGESCVIRSEIARDPLDKREVTDLAATQGALRP